MPVRAPPKIIASHAHAPPERPARSRPGKAAPKPAKGYDRVVGRDRVEIQSTFKPGVKYTSIFGFRSLFGICHIEQRQGVYHFYVPIRFVGATAFAACSPDVVAAEVGFKGVPEAYFRKGATSIAQIPALEKRVREIVREIEEALRNERCQVHIEPIFPDERKLIGKGEKLSEAEIADVAKDLPGPASLETKKAMVRFRVANGDLIDGINRHNRPTEPILIYVLPAPNPQVITPTAWDPYANPLLLAHEFAHCMGVQTEGYELRDYPANGIMKDECYMNALAAAGLKPELLDSDLNEIMLHQSASVRPAVDPKKAAREFRDTSGVLYSRSSDWWTITPTARTKAAKTDVSRLSARTRKPA